MHWWRVAAVDRGGGGMLGRQRPAAGCRGMPPDAHSKTPKCGCERGREATAVPARARTATWATASTPSRPSTSSDHSKGNNMLPRCRATSPNCATIDRRNKKTGVQTGLHPPTKVREASATEPAKAPRQAPQVPSMHTRINAHWPSAPVPLLTTPHPSPPLPPRTRNTQRDASKCWAAAVQAAQKYLPTASAPSARTCSQTRQR